MSLLHILRLTGLSLLLISCADKSIKSSAIKPPSLEIKPAVVTPATKTPVQKNITILPVWVEDHRLVNYISAIGTSKVKRWGGEQAQYNSAMKQARHNLSIAFKKHQTSLSPVKTNQKLYDSQDENISTLVFENAIVKEEWKHPKTGQLYLWLVVPTF